MNMRSMMAYVWLSHRPLVKTPPHISGMLLQWRTSSFRYTAVLADEGFFAYAVRVKLVYGEVDDLVAYLVIMCNDKTSIATDERVMQRKGLQATVFFLRMGVLTS